MLHFKNIFNGSLKSRCLHQAIQVAKEVGYTLCLHNCWVYDCNTNKVVGVYAYEKLSTLSDWLAAECIADGAEPAAVASWPDKKRADYIGQNELVA